MNNIKNFINETKEYSFLRYLFEWTEGRPVLVDNLGFSKKKNFFLIK